MAWRIGQFFMVIGLISLVIFLGTNQAGEPAYQVFCTGTLIAFLGGYLMLRGSAPPAPSRRFRLLRQPREKKEKS